MRFPEFRGEWEEHALGEIGETIIGLTYSPSEVVNDGGTIVLRSSNIKDGRLDYKDIVRVKKQIKERILTQENDILVCARNGSARLIGKNAIIGKEDVGNTFGAFMMVYRSEGNEFIRALLSTKKYYSQVAENLGARINQITTGDFNEFLFSFPSEMKERERIAGFFKLLDKRIATQSEIIRDLKILKGALKKQLINNTQLLERSAPISHFGTLKNGYAFKSNAYNESGDYKIITISNVTGERYINTAGCNKIISIPSDLQPHQLLRQNDILISLTGNVGRVSLCKEGAHLLNQRVGLLSIFHEEEREYIYQMISDIRFEKLMIASAQGAAQMNIGKNDVENHIIPYSDNKETTQKIAGFLKLYDNLIINEQKRLGLYNSLKKYLLQWMFI